jgi:hypothetical protein
MRFWGNCDAFPLGADRALRAAVLALSAIHAYVEQKMHLNPKDYVDPEATWQEDLLTTLPVIANSPEAYSVLPRIMNDRPMYYVHAKLNEESYE